MALGMDVADDAEVDKGFSVGEQRGGTVGALVNNAGCAEETLLTQLRHEDSVNAVAPRRLGS
jgi:NADP-dependent 3-hydroxy acid dehydrogenase YdfG